MELIGSFNVNSYGLVFKINDDIVYTAQIPYGSEIVPPAEPSPVGHTFSGWSEFPTTMPAYDVVVTSTYTVNIYKAVFKIGEETIDTLEIPYGESIKAPEAPEKEGYTFSGWQNIPETMPAEDIVVEGYYTVNVYKAVFMLDGEEYKVVEVAYGDAVELPEVPGKEGYSFTGWKGVPETMPAHDVEISGAYATEIYKAVFLLDGEVFKVVDVAYGDAVELPEVPEKEGYTFAGWENLPETMPAKDIEVSGSYAVNSYKAVFTVDGEVIAVLDVPYGSDIVAPEVEDKEGYSFGWIDLPETMPAHDIEVNGAYEVNRYRLVVYLNDEVYIDEELPYGADIVIPTPEVEDGMQFDGWQEEIPATMPAHDVEIHGTVSEIPVSAVFGVRVDECITVYTMDGVLLYKDVKVSEIKERLTPGIYIANGKKRVIR